MMVADSPRHAYVDPDSEGNCRIRLVRHNLSVFHVHSSGLTSLWKDNPAQYRRTSNEGRAPSKNQRVTEKDGGTDYPKWTELVERSRAPNPKTTSNESNRIDNLFFRVTCSRLSSEGSGSPMASTFEETTRQNLVDRTGQCGSREVSQ